MATVLPQPARRRYASGRAARGNHQVRSALLLAVIAAGVIAVIGLWWQDTPSFAGPGPWLTNAGRVTGLLAGYAVAVLLALMSRVPALDRGLGTDTVTRWHAMGGRYTVSLIVAHAVLITWGYAVSAHTGVVHQTSSLLMSYPDVMMATVAGALFVGVGIISARKARQRLRYETWYYLHLYTYLAIALAFSHQFATGADFADNLTARVLWSALYLGAAGLVVVYRIVLPARVAVRHRMRVTDVRRESDDTVSITMSGQHLAELGAQSGHFFRWRFITRDQWWQSHPYSLSAPPTEHSLRITVKTLGDHSRQLQDIAVGTLVLAEGPYGALTARKRRRRKVLLVAGGVGITPLRALFESLPARQGELTMIVRADREQDVVFRRELDEIAARQGARLHYLVGLPGGDADPFVGTRLRSLVPSLSRHDVYLCGPPGFMVVATERLRACGVPARYLHREYFTF
jgi:predicted ferric reductase